MKSSGRSKKAPMETLGPVSRRSGIWRKGSVGRLARTKKVGWCSVPVNIPGVAWREYESETAFQIYCADWLRKQAVLEPENELYRHWHHSANERDSSRGGFFAKMMGQAKGWPDFVQPGAKLAIELKVMGREASREQREWLAYFKSIGWYSEIVFRFERFREIVLEAVRRG